MMGSDYQDVRAKLLIMNLAAMCALAAGDRAQAAVEHRKRVYHINRIKTLSKVEYYLVCALLNISDRLYRLLGSIAEDVRLCSRSAALTAGTTGKRRRGFIRHTRQQVKLMALGAGHQPFQGDNTLKYI